MLARAAAVVVAGGVTLPEREGLSARITGKFTAVSYTETVNRALDYRLDTLIPASMIGNHESYLKARVFINTLAIAFVFGLLGILMLWLASGIPARNVFWAYVGVTAVLANYVFAYLLLRWTRSVLVAGNWFLASLYLIVSFFAVAIGMSYKSPVAIWPVIPMLGFLVCGKISGYVWFLLSLSAQLVVVWLSTAGVGVANWLEPGTTPLLANALMACFTYGLVIAGCIVALDVHSSHRKALDHERQRYRRLADLDPLTALPNRRAFERAVGALIGSSGAAGAFALVYIDLDGFKKVNDTCGHAAGDAVLAEIAERIRSHVRREDGVARLGGDEFALALVGADNPLDVRGRVEVLLKALERPIPWQDTELYVGGSAGVALYPRDAVRLRTLLDAADRAMYHAKRSGSDIAFAAA